MHGGLENGTYKNDKKIVWVLIIYIYFVANMNKNIVEVIIFKTLRFTTIISDSMKI